MKNKRFSAGALISCCAAVLSLAALIVYLVNIGTTGYFQGAAVSNIVLFSIIAIVLLIGAVILKQLSDNKAVDLIAGALQIGAPVLLAVCLVNLISARVEGFGFIYFSNADVILEVQTPANMASASCAIASIVLYGLAMLVALIAAFCSLRKKKA